MRRQRRTGKGAAMRKLKAFGKRLVVTLGLRRRGATVNEELECHIAMHVEEKVRAGISPEEARRQALVELGGVAQTAEAYREREGLPWLEELGQDVRFALRMLVKHPAFTLIAVVTLALGIGANTILFSVVNGVLLNPVPFPHPEELVMVHAAKPHFDEGSISYPNFRDWQKDNSTLAAFAVS